MSIKVSSVSKNYSSQKVLDAISFDCKKGEIIGFLGPNGAGKSTMMKILMGYIKPDDGAVLVDEIDVLDNPLVAQQNIGYLPEHNPLYKDMYVREYLSFNASIFKVDKDNIETVIQRVGLAQEAHKKIHQLSKGYQQRVGLAAAILHSPTVLILDEPTTGLDVNQLVEIRELIKELGKEKTVLFSTHIMQEVEAVCDRVIIINKGEILLDKPIKELHKNTQQVIEVTFSNALNEAIFKDFKNLTNLRNINSNTWQLTFYGKEDMRSEVFDLAQKNNLKILELSANNQNLEELFRKITVNLTDD